MASLPGGLGFEMHVAGEIRSRAVSASLGRLCMIGLLRARQLSSLWAMYGLLCLEKYSLGLIQGSG